MSREEPGRELSWSARSIRPVIAVYVLGVFGVFIVMAHYFFHSPDAVKALLFAAIGSLVGLAPGMLTRLEYRMTEAGLMKRSRSEKTPHGFTDVFRWDELSHVVPTPTGFKYFKVLEESNGVLRFLKTHFSSNHSGEVRVEEEDREAVFAFVVQGSRGALGVPPSQGSGNG